MFQNKQHKQDMNPMHPTKITSRIAGCRILFKTHEAKETKRSTNKLIGRDDSPFETGPHVLIEMLFDILKVLLA
jgi:hypothetical protein